MNLENLNKLIETNDPENINLAYTTIKQRLSQKNVYGVYAMLCVNHPKRLRDDFDDVFEKFGIGDNISISDLFSNLLSNSFNNIDELETVKEYYFKYISQLVDNIKLTQIKKNEKPITDF